MYFVEKIQVLGILYNNVFNNIILIIYYENSFSVMSTSTF